jgi:hypothetical protein
MRQGTQGMRYVSEHIARTKAKPLSVRQSAVLACIRERHAAGGDFPTEQDLRARFGWKYSKAPEDVLLALATKGLIEQDGWRRVGRRLKPRWRLKDRDA